MKKFTYLSENCITSDVNPGNGLNLGVTNHYTPIENILSNIKNLFCCRIGVVASVAEDGVSIKLESSKFVSEKSIYDTLDEQLYNDGNSLSSYLYNQGLDKMSIVSVGMFYVAYFSPSDIKIAEPGLESNSGATVHESFDEEITSQNINEEDEELGDIKNKKIVDIIDQEDKLKASKELSEILKDEVSLPKDVYFTGIKIENDETAIALRWSYKKKRPHDANMEMKRTLMYIFGQGSDSVFVESYDKNSIVKLPEAINKAIKDVLDAIGAKKTKKPYVFSLGDASKPSENSAPVEDNKDEEEDKDEEKNK